MCNACKTGPEYLVELAGLALRRGVAIVGPEGERKTLRRQTPMLAKAVQDAMNEQIKTEFYSGYQYLSMAAYCESVNLPGFAHWMRIQAREEVEHAMKL